MAVSRIEEKILGRLARQTAPSNALLSASFHQVLGLSILLSRRLVKARRLRKLDRSRDTKSLQLYHHIIWLSREGLAITESFILPYCQDGEQGPECRVMAAKLRASLYHIFCLFHNHPPISQLSGRSHDFENSPSSALTSKTNNGQSRKSPRRSPKAGKENSQGQRRRDKAPLRDPIPSMTSDTSYVTNPYAAGPAKTPPPAGPPPPIPTEIRRTPTRPPGLAPINVSASQSAASFLLPPLNFVPLAREHFDTAQHLASNLLPPANALRLSVSLEYCAFLWDCAKEHEKSRKLARRTIKEVYASSDGLDDDEFADASSLVQALGGIVKRGATGLSPDSSVEKTGSPDQRANKTPQIDRTIAVSPTYDRNRVDSPSNLRSILKTPERLSTVPEVDSTDNDDRTQGVSSPPLSRLSSTSQQASDKANKRRAVEQAEEIYRRNSVKTGSNVSTGSHSRQPTPQEGTTKNQQQQQQQQTKTVELNVEQSAQNHVEEKRQAVLKALEIISAVSRGLYVPDKGHGSHAARHRLI